MENKNINLEEHSCDCGSGCCGEHHHEHSHGCCCGEHHKEIKVENLTEDENAFLNYLMEYQFLPVTRFVVKSSKEESFLIPAVGPVYLDYKDDSVERVNFVSEILNSLEEKGVISIDYDIKLNNFDYSDYYESDLYKNFVKTVEEGKTRENFLGDTAEIETGSMAITDEYASLISE